MKFFFHVTLALIFSLILFSCDSRNDIVEGKYWVRIKNDKTKGLVKFMNDGRYIYYEKLDKDYKYNIVAHQFTFTDELGEIKKYRIIDMNHNIIKLEDFEVEKANDTIIFLPANHQDYIIGDWVNPDNNTKIEFSTDHIVEMKIDRDTAVVQKVREYKFIDDNYISINGTNYSYKFDDDLKKLQIFQNNQIQFNLIRESLRDKLNNLIP